MSQMRSSHEKSRIQHRKLRGIIESQEHRLPVQGVKGGGGEEISNPESQKIIPTQKKKKSQEEISRLGSSFQTKKPRTLTQLLTNSCLPGTLSFLQTNMELRPNLCLFGTLSHIFWGILRLLRIKICPYQLPRTFVRSNGSGVGLTNGSPINQSGVKIKSSKVCT